MEGIASAYLGHINYLGLKKSDKAKKYYTDCLRLLDALKPQTFNDKKWHQDLMKYSNEIA